MPSMSARTIVYKGMLLAGQVGSYYKDLQDPRVVSALALVHQRFSTNTFPTWDLAHPFRMIAHNGEINTLRGNVNWIRARQGAISSPILGKDLDKIWPLIYDGQSDSASFDNALELLVMGGYSLAHAMMMLIPEAWEGHTLMDPSRRAFYEYHAAMMEPWDGPAAVAFTDGRQIGATLDRNGLRPARYLVTDDDLVIMASEMRRAADPRGEDRQEVAPAAGQDVPGRPGSGPHHRRQGTQGRAGQRQALPRVDRAHPHQARRSARARRDSASAPSEPLLDRQQAFGYTQEDIKFILTPMAQQRRGADRLDGQRLAAGGAVEQEQDALPLLQAAVRAGDQPADRSDPRRAGDVAGVLHRSEAQSARHRRDESADAPGSEPAGARLRADGDHPPHRALHRGKFKSCELDITYPVAWGKQAIEARLASLCAQAEDAVRSGYSILIISDRKMDRDHVAIPALLALSAIHQHLVGKGLRTSTGLVVETGSAREVHHFALLGGYGAEAMHPYLALETILDLADRACCRQASTARRRSRTSSRRSARAC